MRSVLIGGVSALVLWLISHYPSWWLFVPATVVWLCLLLSLYFYKYRVEKRGMAGWPVIIMSACALVALLVLLDWIWATYILIVLGGFIMFFLFGEAQKSNISGLTHEIRPIRRILMMLWVFIVFALSCLAFALNVFFPGAPFWLLAFLLSALIGWVSVIIWQMYFIGQTQSFLVWALTLALGLWEIIWVLHLLPLGYFVLGALTTWVWYILHLFVRFRLGTQGIVWRRQIWFLVTNAVLFFVILFLFVRW
ncbi:MAG: hypothetical protein AAB963_02215, partial [Patescibacteria group bacterium]